MLRLVSEQDEQSYLSATHKKRDRLRSQFRDMLKELEPIMTDRQRRHLLTGEEKLKRRPSNMDSRQLQLFNLALYIRTHYEGLIGMKDRRHLKLVHSVAPSTLDIYRRRIRDAAFRERQRRQKGA